MIRKILLATDGLSADAAVQQSAIVLAGRFGAELTALGVIDVPWIRRLEPVPLGGMPYKTAREERQLTKALERVREALERLATAAAAAGVVATTVELEGDPLELLGVEASGHDLVVIGRGASFHAASDEGVSDLVKALVRDGRRPVLAVAAPALLGSRVLVAFDGSVPAARAMHMAALLGLVGGAQVRVVSVDAKIEIAQQLAQRAASLLASHGADVAAVGLASDADPADIILTHARTFAADLVVMGAYGHGGLRDMIFGSCTRHLLAECPAALMLQH